MEHEPGFGFDKEVGCAAKQVIKIWKDAYEEDRNRKGLDERRKQQIRQYLGSLDPQLRQALTQKDLAGKSILARAPSIALNEIRAKQAA